MARAIALYCAALVNALLLFVAVSTDDAGGIFAAVSGGTAFFWSFVTLSSLSEKAARRRRQADARRAQPATF